MKVKTIAVFISICVLSSQKILAETCPNLSGVYTLNANSCQIQGDGSTLK